MLQQHLLPLDREIIQSIPLNVRRGRDSLIWLYDKKDVLNGIVPIVKRIDLECVCVILWSIWWNRNIIVHKGDPKNAADLVFWALELLSEFQGTHRALSAAVIHLEVPHKAGEIVAAISKPLKGSFSAEIGEFLALREVLLLAKRLNLTLKSAEVDAITVANGVSKFEIVNCNAKYIVNDIKALLQEVSISGFDRRRFEFHLVGSDLGFDRQRSVVDFKSNPDPVRTRRWFSAGVCLRKMVVV
ncbi:hypothetical protein QYF36_017062 [Acer negundo]|nr:hypothetical protein QYF36_017062 [Acer negundo]